MQDTFGIASNYYVEPYEIATFHPFDLWKHQFQVAQLYIQN